MGYHMVFLSLSLSFLRFTVLFLFMLVCVHNHLGVPRSQKTAADPLGLELQGVMSNLM